MPELILEFQLREEVGTIDQVGDGPFGQRMIAALSGGSFTGERLTGSVVGANGDWLLAGRDGYGRTDVRLTLKTVDSAVIYLQYCGLVEMTATVTAIVGGGAAATDYGDQYLFSSPRLETGDERYAWVNQTIFVGEGRLLPGPVVEYRVYRVAHC
ncbi:DUF3237 domain-containing protein [Actinomycetospora straminea]|uniref:UPF0311 protein GCM10023203_37650 n=1 Tax=Actinomycetospora straminea TaxID=663607 RepID=A0ABP9EMI3_9PSEU|nr:DUF3237 domain-containing protein [Actinomycetospora straminea]MDD7934978.1 DUF3237 domain-containing protein [Actinomycetospora straminea]